MWILLIIIGVIAGVTSGLLGVGGGVIVVPALMLVLGMSQVVAQGTSLAFLLAPIGIGAVLIYARNGDVNWGVAGLLAIGFLVGGFLGSKLVMQVPEKYLSKLFGIFLLFVAAKMILMKR